MPFWIELHRAGVGLLRAGVDLVFPPGCAACDRPLASRELPWCGPCAEELLAETAATYCPRCGLGVGPGMVDEAGCAECRPEPLRLDGVARVGRYHHKAGELLKKFKFGRQHRLDGVLGELMAAAVGGRPWHERIEALVPVPGDWRARVRYRGHPAGLLAAELGRRLRLPVLPMVYLKGKLQRQTELSNTDRPANVRGKFHVHRRARVTGARLCIVDDVSTTGSTLREIARALRKAGAAEVYAAVLCKTDHDRTDGS